MLPKEIVDFIAETEACDQPWKWPGGDSGITIGYGFDLGYESASYFASVWRSYLPSTVFSKLSSVVGLKGEQASLVAPSLKNYRIPCDVALEVFKAKILPHYEEETEKAFTGYNNLPDLVKGALVSLVYNRGTDFTDRKGSDRRKEMRTLRSLVFQYHKSNNNFILQAMADQFRSMKRLWVGKGLDGLITRRENEARLIERCITKEGDK